MKSTIYCLLFLITCCGVAKPQVENLDAIFEENFKVLDSVAAGTKQQAALTKKESAFLYIVAIWSGVDTKFDHNKEFPIDTATVKSWRSWYLRNSKRIDAVEFNKALEILTKFFTEGIFPDEEIAYWEQLVEKYNKLK